MAALTARVAIAAVVVAALLSGCAADADGEARDQADDLELAIEAIPFVSRASAHVVLDGIGVNVSIDAPTEKDYLATVEAVVATGAASPLADRKRMGYTLRDEGDLRLSNVDPTDLEGALAAARIGWHYATDDAVTLGDVTLSGGEVEVELVVDGESLVAPTLEDLIAKIDEAGLLHRPSGLVVRVSL